MKKYAKLETVGAVERERERERERDSLFNMEKINYSIFAKRQKQKFI